MTTSVVESVKTQSVGFAPILQCYFERCGIAKIIDDNLELDPRRKILTHGQASVSMITGILFQVLQLYRLCKFATETTVLDVILPGIAPNEYFDDLLVDTLDAIFDYGIGNLEIQTTQHMIKAPSTWSKRLTSKVIFAITTQPAHQPTATVIRIEPQKVLKSHLVTARDIDKI